MSSEQIARKREGSQSVSSAAVSMSDVVVSGIGDVKQGRDVSSGVTLGLGVLQIETPRGLNGPETGSRGVTSAHCSCVLQ